MLGEQLCVDNERVALPAANRVTEVRALTSFRVTATVEVNDTFGIEEFAADNDAIFLYIEFIQID